MTNHSLHSVVPRIIFVISDVILEYFGFLRPVAYILGIDGPVVGFALIVRIVYFCSSRFSSLVVTDA